MSKSSHLLDRRQFLTLTACVPLAALLHRVSSVSAQSHARRTGYSAEVGILYDAWTFHVQGTLDEAIDRAAGRYEVRAAGEGAGIANRIESSGRMRDGSWVPERAVAWFQVRGRESRSEITYDWTTRKIDYRFRGETFFLRRLRVVTDTVTVPDGVRVDDVFSAVLNYADGYWKADPDGVYRTSIVRRRRRDREDPDEIDPKARAELAPFELNVGRDEATGKPAAFFDMTRFSSWARAGRPARVLFGADRRPELIASSLVLGTTVTIRLGEPERG